MLRGIRRCLGFILCPKRLRLSCNEDECKPLAAGARGWHHDRRLLRGMAHQVEVIVPVLKAPRCERLKL